MLSVPVMPAVVADLNAVEVSRVPLDEASDFESVVGTACTVSFDASGEAVAGSCGIASSAVTSVSRATSSSCGSP